MIYYRLMSKHESASRSSEGYSFRKSLAYPLALLALVGIPPVAGGAIITAQLMATGKAQVGPYELATYSGSPTSPHRDTLLLSTAQSSCANGGRVYEFDTIPLSDGYIPDLSKAHYSKAVSCVGISAPATPVRATPLPTVVPTLVNKP
jgi:hypothetical protein